jgi:UDP-sulfoquinovose synthase
MAKKVIILGGDGFCGWPTSLHLSNLGYDVLILDNLSRRNIDNELGVESLTPIQSLPKRIKVWHRITKKTIRFINIDLVQDYDRLVAILKAEKPDGIVHFAEQRAAPYSMKSSWHKRYTVNNNVNVTNNVLCAILDSGLDIHLVHLGTMGVYGYGTPGAALPEGYLPIKITGDEGQTIEKEILHPVNPGSVYHMTKTLDQLLFFYFNKNDKIRITDLHQGIVWGTATKETKLDEALINRFDYDGDYGTVLNRFLMQAAIKHPLTVHGTGGQTRAFIHLQDTVNCIEYALLNPPAKGARVEIFNQVTETHKVRDLAKLISTISGVSIQHLENPRNEDDENELNVKRDKFLSLGLKPILLSDGLLYEVTEIAKKYAHRADPELIICKSVWKHKAV